METLDREFEAVTIEDIPLISSYLKKAKYEESNHNIIGFILWQETYPLWKYEGENWLILLGIHNQELFVYMPLCEKRYFKEAILAAKKVFDYYHVPFVLSCFVKEEMDFVTEVFPNYSGIEYRDNADYVYLTEKLRSFSGKKLQRKRNHLNAFYKMYEQHFVYESMNGENALECISFLRDWKEEDKDEFLDEERRGTERLLTLWDLLPAKGGIIRIDGKIKAFIVGSVLSERMCQINIEKADNNYRGLYQAILKEFLDREFLEYTYINREDDMGKENIRQAKMAYYPEFLIMKYRLCEEVGNDPKIDTGR